MMPAYSLPGSAEICKKEMEMKTDMQLRENVEQELLLEPSVRSTDIGVIVEDGVVTLTGKVSTFPVKWEAGKAAVRVSGVKAVANQIEVKLAPGSKLTPGSRYADEEIARASTNALEWSAVLPNGLQVVVEDGWVTLKGKVNWQFQKRIAGDIVWGLDGVKGVTNAITVTPRVAPSIVKAKIEASITRNAFLDAKGIQVKADEGKVTLEGTVYSWLEKTQAEEAAWSAPGVTEVDNNLVVY
jgi:osmotically-inducible protein OsmY